jgi:hypothetical protein
MPMKVKTLYIDRWKSECGDCHKSVDWSALICHPLNGDAPCDTREYEQVTSHYLGMADSVEPMRPDLHWLSPESLLTGTE